MTNNELIKKKIIYRSIHRGSKEMDLLLGSFTKKYINKFNEDDLKDLDNLLLIDDDILYKWYFENNSSKTIPTTKVSLMLKDFKL